MGGGCKLWLFFCFFYHFVWLCEVTFSCFILVAQKSCCLIRSPPGLPTGTRMYNLTMSSESTPGADRNSCILFTLHVNSLIARHLWIRVVLEKDLCTHCRKPFNGEAKMILDDMNINCHATCFKVSALFSLFSFLQTVANLRWLKSADGIAAQKENKES